MVISVNSRDDTIGYRSSLTTVDNRDAKDGYLSLEYFWCNGKLIKKSVEEHLAKFTYSKELDFDSLYPVFVVCDKYATCYNWRRDVVELVKMLPVMEMYAVYEAFMTSHGYGEEEGKVFKDCKHAFLCMLRWLETCMDLSKINREATFQQLRAIKQHLSYQQSELCAGRLNMTVLQWENEYNESFDLWFAVNLVDLFARKIEDGDVWEVCHCDKCVNYRTPEWADRRPAELPPDVLPVKTIPVPDQFPRVIFPAGTSSGFSPYYRINSSEVHADELCPPHELCSPHELHPPILLGIAFEHYAGGL
ncbi:hypothetical protein DVH05_014681 [Phytophthora capsici]|nr:hypothetical protein DVH05_014681 [Phytophthora capsici]